MHAVDEGRDAGAFVRTLQWLRDHIAAPILAGILLAVVLVVLGITIDPGPPPTDRVQVANVYNLPKDKGLLILSQQGFVNVRSITVCSNSVGQGRIREVLLDDNAPVVDETVFVGPAGPKAIEVLLSTKLLVKVSTGKACP